MLVSVVENPLLLSPALFCFLLCFQICLPTMLSFFLFESCEISSLIIFLILTDLLPNSVSLSPSLSLRLSLSGEVQYNIAGFAEKNRDSTNNDMRELLAKSRNKLIRYVRCLRSVRLLEILFR